MKNFYQAFLLSFLFLATSIKSNAQTSLVAGDILFTGFNGDPAEDNFSFVLLRNITANTQIRFTDYGWRTNTSSFNSGGASETEIVFTAGLAINAGVEITIVGTALPTATLSIGGSAGTVTFTAGSLGGGTALAFLSLNTSGDQLLAYQGSFASPTFIAGVHFNSYNTIGVGDPTTTTDANWDGDLAAINGTSCSKPTTLTAGTNAVWLGTTPNVSPFFTEPENAIYNCTGTLNSVANVQAAVCNRANWNMSDVSTYTLPSGCTYLSTPAPSFTTNPTASSSCAGLSASFNVVATGSSITFTWQEATNAAFTTGVTNISNTGIYSISSTATTSTLTILDNTTVNGRYYRCTATNIGGSVNSSIAGLTPPPICYQQAILV